MADPPPLPDPGLDIRTLNALLLHVHRAGCEVAFDRFQALMLEEIQTLIPFDSACWGSVSRQPVELQHAFLFNCDDSFLNAYRPHVQQDCFLAALSARPGVTIHLADLVARARLARSTVYRAVGMRYGIGCALGTLLAQPQSPLGDLLVLWRHAANHPFNTAERLGMELLMPHLAQAYRVARLREMFGESPRLGAARGMVDARGILHEFTPGFIHALRAHWPGWQGSRLPAALLPGLRKGLPFQIGTDRVEVTRRGELFCLEVRAPGALDRLSPRERQIALRYAHGETHAAIARALALSPATVRNHLAHCYRKLAVANKAELAAQILHRPT